MSKIVITSLIHVTGNARYCNADRTIVTSLLLTASQRRLLSGVITRHRYLFHALKQQSHCARQDKTATSCQQLLLIYLYVTRDIIAAEQGHMCTT